MRCSEVTTYQVIRIATSIEIMTLSCLTLSHSKSNVNILVIIFFRVLTGDERAKKAEQTQRNLFIVNRDSKFVDNQIMRATERPRIESKE